MTLDEAISHAREVADAKRTEAIETKMPLGLRGVTHIMECEQCAEEHEQLAEWLEELEQIKEQKNELDIRKGQ